MVLNTETVQLPTFTTGFVLPSIKIVYYQHLQVSFEEFFSLRLSDHFALVVGCINNNWLKPWFRTGKRVIPRRSLSPICLDTTTPATSVPLWKAIWNRPCSLLWHWRIFDHAPQRNPGLYSQFAWRGLRRRPNWAHPYPTLWWSSAW